MASGILAALAGGLGGYSGALDNQYKMQKEDERDKLKNERAMSLESLRASNQATLQQAGFTQQKELLDIGETKRETATKDERLYQAELLKDRQSYEAGASERAWQAKQDIVGLEMKKWTDTHEDATPEQIENRHEILQGWAEITKGMDAVEAGKLRIDAFKMWDAKEPKDRDKLVAAYKNANPNSINPAEDAMLEFATLAVSGGRGRAGTDTDVSREIIADIKLQLQDAEGNPKVQAEIKAEAEAKFKGITQYLDGGVESERAIIRGEEVGILDLEKYETPIISPDKEKVKFLPPTDASAQRKRYPGLSQWQPR